MNKEGNLLVKSRLPENKTLFGELLIESAVKDERGKYVTGRVTAKYSSRDLFVGLKSNDKRMYKDEPDSTEILVLDTEGKTVSGKPVRLSIEHEEIILNKVKGKYNTTLTRYIKKWTEEETHNLVSTKEPIKISFIPKKVGNYRVTAYINDTKGREHFSRLYGEVSDKKEEKFESDYHNLEISSEKSTYKVGDIARYTVKNPFPGAKAFISIERYGVIKHWVQQLDDKDSVIEVKVEENFMPGFCLSVLVNSPGTAHATLDDKEDVGKPDFRMGYLMATVTDSKKELLVSVQLDKETRHKPGDLVNVKLHVAPQINNEKEPIEYAIVVINEEVLSLLFNNSSYFDPFKGFYSDINMNVNNFNLLMSLAMKYRGGALFESDNSEEFTLEEITVTGSQISKNYQEPLINGSGSKFSDFRQRSNLKFVAYWNPSIIADKDGKASIEFEAPDNLTGWRIFAIAVTPTDQMGLGEGKFAVTKDTEMRPVMPNQVTEGDSFKAGFSIMNRTDKTRELTVNVIAEGAIETEPGKNTKEITQTITAEANKRTTVWLPLKTKGSGKIKFTARGGDATDQDGLTHDLEVRKMVSLETAATYGTTIDKKVTESLQFPEGIRTDVGNVKVSLSPTVIGNVEGAFQYMRDYPYECWEQNLTKAVMASHYKNLKKYMPADFTWEGSENLTQSMLDKASSLQAPNGGMTYYTPQDQYADPYLSAYTAIAFTWLAERGYKIPSDVQEKLNGYLLSMLKKEEISDFYSKGMASTVSAVALAALAKQGKIGTDDIKQYYPHVKDMDLFGKAHFLMAAIQVKGTEDMQKEMFNMIISHADQTAGKFVFSETMDSGYSRILSSSLRTNAAILSSLIAYGKTEQGKKLVEDIPFKIVRYITQTRRASGRWENTQENIFCMNALIEYSTAYENTKPDMSIITMLGKEVMGKTKFIDMRDKPVELSRPIKENDPGRKTAITIEREGEGRIYYSAGMTYAPVKPNTEPINAGIDIKREYAVERNGEWVLLKSPMEIRRGELVRIDLFVSIPAARNFLVVSDPVPGGLEPVNSDLATSSIVDSQKGEYKPAGGSWWFQYGDWFSYGISRWSFYHRELRHHGAIFYSEYLSPGNYHLSYTAQAIASGEFTVMPAHAEEMYDSDIFGKSGAGVLNVKMED